MVSWSTQSLARGKKFESPELWKSDETDFCGQESGSGCRCAHLTLFGRRFDV